MAARRAVSRRMLRAALCAALASIVASAALSSARAAAPPTPRDRGPDASSPTRPDEPRGDDPRSAHAGAAGNATRGVLVIARLAGADAARRRVAERLAGALSSAPSVSAADGYVIGVADDLEAAIAWSIERMIPTRAGRLDDALALDRRRAPFAGVLAADVAGGDDVALLSVELATMSIEGVLRAMDAPRLFTTAPDGSATPSAEAATRLALDVVEVIPPRALLFAAPASVIPPADQAHARIVRGDEALVFGQRDVCGPIGEIGRDRTDPQLDGPNTCIRWAQLLIRSRGLLLAGWVPAAWVAPSTAGRADAPRAPSGDGPAVARPVARGAGDDAPRLRPSHVERGQAHFAVIGDLPRGASGSRGASRRVDDLRVPARVDGGFPRVTLERDGDAWVLRTPDGDAREVELNTTIPAHDE